MDEPWYDWLPIYALLLLFAQTGAIFISKRVPRWVVVGACFVAIWAMALYVWSIDTGPDEGVNIGAGVMVLWVLATCVVLVAALIAEGVRSAWRSRKSKRRP